MKVDKGVDIFEKLFVLMKGKCDNKGHSNCDAVYYCTYNRCKTRFVCQECIIENQNHFTSHLKYFIPLDVKQKFLNKLNIVQIDEESVENQTKQLRESYNDSINKINKFYNDIKTCVVGFIDEHKEKHIQAFKTDLEEQISKHAKFLLNYNTFLKNLTPEINIFVMQGDPSRFVKLYEKINQEGAKLEENYKKGQTFLEEIKNGIKIGNIDNFKVRVFEFIEKNFKFNNEQHLHYKNLDTVARDENLPASQRNDEDRIKEKFMQMRLEEDKISEREKETNNEKKKNTKNKLEELKLKVMQISKVHK